VGRACAYDSKGALRDLDETIRLNPKLAAAYGNRGDVWRRKGDLGRARSAP
jgi:hypothetical protein